MKVVGRLSLTAKFNLLAITLTMATAIAITLYFVSAEAKRHYVDLVHRGHSIAAITAAGCEYGIYAEDLRTLDMLLDGFDGDPNIAYAAFLNGEKRLLRSRTLIPSVDIPDVRDHGNEGTLARVSHREFLNRRDSLRYIDILAPVVTPARDEIEGIHPSRETQPRVIGFVQLGLSQKEQRKRTGKFLRSAGLFTSLLAVAGVGLTLLITRRFVSPIQEIVAFAHSISEEKLDRQIRVEGTPEINHLAHSLNQMLVRLRTYRDQVEEHAAALAVANLQEVAGRRQAEEERTLLSMAVEQAGETILITDTEGTIQYVNPAFEEVSGYARSEVIGKNPRMFKSGRQDREFYRRMWDTLRRGEVWTGNFINRRKDGKPFEETAVISPVREAGGRIVNYVAVKRDVTREVQLEEQLRQSQKIEAVGKLAGGIAHDFNNLLTAITGYSEILLVKLPIHDTRRREVEEIKKAGERAASLTRQLLAFSRKQVLQPKVLGLNAVIANMDAMLRRLIGEDVEFVTVLAEDLRKVRVDPGQIEQVVMNLAVNARDAMPAGGKLTIETANVDIDAAYSRIHPPVRPGPHVMLAVSDTGCGIDEETRSRIFEPFFTTKPQGKGTGLGLSTVYGIVKQSQGYICVYSNVGKGTTFKVYLPCAEETGERAAHPEEPAAADPRGTETVLLAEDEDQVRELVRSLLEENGYRVLAARDGNDALEIGARHDGPIHLLVTDVVMPQMGGAELAKRLTETQPGIKVLYMSGYTENAVVHQGVLKSDAAFIQKPFRPDELGRKVREVLDG